MKRLLNRISTLLRSVKALPINIRRNSEAFTSSHYATYKRLRSSFSSDYLKIRHLTLYQTPLWDSFNAQAEQCLLPFPAWNFLRNTVLRQTMLIQKRGKLLLSQLEFIEQHWGTPQAHAILPDPAFGAAPIDNIPFATSHNTIHHASHLARWEHHSGKSLSDISTIVEWGGGYGNLARLCSHLSPTSTHIIIDTPLFAQLQWLYLSITLPNRTVTRITNPEQSIKSGHIAIIPVGLIERINIPQADLFISTWALSESSRTAQDFVAQSNWFEAHHLLIGYQERNEQLPDSDYLGVLAQRDGATILPITHLKRQFYAFR
jgi:hypothetical protein